MMTSILCICWRPCVTFFDKEFTCSKKECLPHFSCIVFLSHLMYYPKHAFKTGLLNCVSTQSMLLKQGYINVLRIILTSRTLKRGNIFGKIERKITRNMIRLLQSKNFQKRIWFLQECSKLQCGTISVGSSLQTTFCNKFFRAVFERKRDQNVLIETIHRMIMQLMPNVY